jgi:hypothetical protein
MPAQIGEYRKHPVISLLSKDVHGVERKFSFGLKKAKLILENLDDIRVFVETSEQKNDSP